jgi:gamma-glutamyltranspeptidase/glutathione hydrolase
MLQKKFSLKRFFAFTTIKLNPLLIILLAVVLFSPSLLFAETSQIATSHSGMVVTAEKKATNAAVSILRRGGNAIDAAIAAQWVLNVVEPQSSGLGGGGFLLYYEAKTGRVYSFDGRETAPEGAFAQMFLDDQNNPMPFWPDRISGGLAVGVPGTLKLLDHVYQKFSSGHFTFGELFDPAIKIADEGFEVSQRLAGYLLKERDRLALFPATKEIFFEGENPFVEGQILYQKDLANTFRQISQEGADVFYKGTIAKQISKAVRKAPYHPASLTLKDLQNYQIVEREAVHIKYRGYDLYGMGAPSSGGITTFQTLNILSHFDLKKLSKAERLYVMGEAQRIAFIDRNQYIADPDQVPTLANNLLSETMAAYHAEEIKENLQIKKLEFKKEVKVEETGNETSHISIIDRDGNAVSFTTTVEHLFGSAMIVPGRGFFLNNELTDFDAFPWNEKGQARVNAANPGKRPRSSMSPTIVLKDEKPWMVLGSPGGSTIIGTVVNLLVNMIDLETSLAKAMKAPKVIHRGEKLEMEETFFREESFEIELAEAGLIYEAIEPFGNAQALVRTQDGFVGVSDLRGQGKAKGY